MNFKKFLLPVLLLCSQNLFAQQTVDMADQLRADGKIWVVVAVIAVTFAGIIIYLARLDRQITKIEKDVKKTQANTTDFRP
jgi:CcmD family protein